MQEVQVQLEDQEDHLQEEIATQFSALAWKIPWTEEPGGLCSLWGCKQPDMTEKLNTQAHCTLPLKPIYKHICSTFTFFQFSLSPTSRLLPLGTTNLTFSL